MKPIDHSKEYLTKEIEELRQKIVELEKSNKLFADTFNGVPDPKTALEHIKVAYEDAVIGMTMATVGGELIKVNKSMCDMVGYTEEELLGMNFRSFTHPNDVDENIELRQKVIDGELNTFEMEKRYIRKDGQIISALLSASLIRDSQGEPLYFNTQIQDITERKQYEEALKESEDRYRGLVELSPDTIIVYADGKVTFINKAGLEIFGIKSYREIIGKSVLKFVHRDSIPTVIQRMKESLEGRMLPPLEEKLVKIDGTVIDAEVTAAPITFLGQSATQVMIRDISLRKKAEAALAAEKERLAVTLKSIGEGVITTDTEGKVLLLNKVAEVLTGWTQDEAFGQPLNEVFKTFLEKHRLKNNVRERVLKLSKDIMNSQDVILVAKDGKEIHVNKTIDPIYLDDGSVIGAVIVFRDISEHRKMEEELRKIEKLKSVGFLAGGIAHDFNNILTVILGNISLAKVYAQDDFRLTESLIEIEKASQHARDLTQQLLTFAKGGAPIRKIMAIENLIYDTVNFALRGTNIKCDFSIAKDLWPVEVDEGQINQVINNLVINALQAMPKGGIIKVIAENKVVNSKKFVPLKKGNYVKVSIEDQGGGIAEEDIAHIFDPYFTTKEMGSGLGLATTYSIIEKHEGYIKVDSQLGKGTRFDFYLPASSKSLPTTDEKKEHLKFGKGKVLVMDDEEDIRNIVSAMLHHLGYAVFCVPEGEKAIGVYQEALNCGQPYDAVILDLTIPGGMGGEATIKQLIDLDPQVKAIVSSGYSNDPVMANYKRYGFKGIVAKPYEIQELSEIVYKVIECI